MTAKSKKTIPAKKDGVFATINGIQIPEYVCIENGYASGAFAKVIAAKATRIGAYKYVKPRSQGWDDCGHWVYAPGASVTVEFIDGPFEGKDQTYLVCQNDDGIVSKHIDQLCFKVVEKVSESGEVTY